jgi:hypothetical protein
MTMQSVLGEHKTNTNNHNPHKMNDAMQWFAGRGGAMLALVTAAKGA